MMIGIRKKDEKKELMELDTAGLISLISANVAKEAGNIIATEGVKQGFISSTDDYDSITVRFDCELLSIPDHTELVRKAMAYDAYIDGIVQRFPIMEGGRKDEIVLG